MCWITYIFSHLIENVWNLDQNLDLPHAFWHHFRYYSKIIWILVFGSWCTFYAINVVVFIHSLYRIIMLADWFARKNLRRHCDIYNVYYYWHDSGSYNYWQDESPPILEVHFHSAPSWLARITSTEFYKHRRMTIEIYLHWMIV